MSIPKERISVFSIRSFKPEKDKSSSERFAQGHLEVLNAFGFKLSSASESWMHDPKTFGILIESPENHRVYGGARVHLNNGKNPLPVIAAIDREAPEIADYIKSHDNIVLGELCGLWNSMSIAGMGVGSVFSIRAAIALAGMIGVDSMIALCSVHSYRMAHKYGFNLVETVGTGGEIPYAGAKQIARLTIQKDIKNLPGADPEELRIIQNLREQPLQTITDKLRDEFIELRFDLTRK